LKLNWHSGVLYAMTMGMEMCWLYVLAALLNEQVAGRALSISGILAFYPLSFGINKLLSRIKMPLLGIVRRSVCWLIWAALALIAVKTQLFGNTGWFEAAWIKAIPVAFTNLIYSFGPEILLLILTAVIWKLGQRLSCSKLSFSATVSEFQFGLVMLLMIFFIISMMEIELVGLIPVAMIFFLFALGGMSISHAREGKSWLSSLSQGRWMGLLLGGIGIILAVGLVIGFVATPELVQVLLDALKWIWELIIRVMSFIAGLFPPSGEPPEMPPASPLPEGSPERTFMWSMSETLRSVLRIVWLIVVIGVILVAMWSVSSQILDWLRRKLAGTEGAEFEPLEGAFKADLLILLKMILQKIRSAWLAFRQRRQGHPLIPEIESVRQIYRCLLKWGSASGYPRQLAQTPYEYLRTLAVAQPELMEDIAFITSRYVSVRYGSSLPDKNELHELKQSWHRIKSVGSA
jgi:hypothetical protein